MTYVVIEDVPASWERYDAVADAVRTATPGLLWHLAGPTDEGFRIVEVWASEAAWAAFAGDLDAALDAVDPDVRPRGARRDLQAIHVVVGDALAAGPSNHAE